MLYGSLSLALILGLLGYLFYNQQRIKNRQLQKEGELKEALARIETQNKLQEQRLRISRDLHDNIGSQLTFVTSSVENLKYGLGKEETKTQKKLGEISNFTTQTIYELRDTIWAMNKSNITSEDLQTRISNFIEKAGEAREQVDFQFIVSEGIEPGTSLTSIQGMNIYRIIQEAVNNALKHAEATSIIVNIDKLNSTYIVKIQDNGNGFNVSETEAGNGLQNIKKRASDLKGSAEIVSERAKGTTVQISFPE
jgi:signal transduction histidine kinase